MNISNIRHSKPSIIKDYISIFYGLMISIVIFSLIFFYYSYQTFIKNKKENILAQTGIISRSINSQSCYIENLLFYIGKQIISTKDNNPDKISKILMNDLFIKDESIGKLFSQTFVNWVDADAVTHYSSQNGEVFLKIKTLNSESHNKELFDKSKNSPWKIFFSNTSRGSPANQWMLNIFYGLSDENNNFIGSISMPLVIEEIVSKIEKEFINKNIDYYVVDNNGKLLFHSPKADGGYIIENFVDNNFLNSLNSKSVKQVDFKVENIKIENATKVHGLPIYLLTGYNINKIYKQILRELLSKLSIFTVVCVLVIIIFIMIRKIIINPIEHLSNIAHRISKGEFIDDFNNYNVRELSILSLQLKNLVIYIAELKDIQKKLEIANMTISENNENSEKIIEQRTKDLENALKIKTDIINNISHEVKTPILGITGISRELVELWEKLSTEERKKYVFRIARSSERLSSLVSNLLSFSNLEKGEINLSKDFHDIKDLVSSSIEECRLLYLGNKNIEISSEFKDEINPYIFCDFNKIFQVLRNLISNAIKYTDTGHIKIIISDNQSNNIIVSVHDSGIGIPDAELVKIFDEFYQSSFTNSGAGGSGLGLTISKGIIEAHKGKIWAENSKDGGSIFSFSIPLDSEKSKNINSNKINSKKNKIIIIDDEEVTHLSLELMLYERDDDIIYFYDAKKGMEYIINNQIDVDIVLLDLMMPDISGKEIIDQLHQLGVLNNIKILVQSGKIVRFNFEESHYPNVKFISKPYTKIEINTAIDDLLE